MNHLRLDRQQAQNGAEEGRLSGTVRADECDRLAFVDLDVDIVERLEIAVAGNESVC